MRYDSFSDNALVDLYRPVAFVSAVILCFLFLAAPAQANYIFNNATGQWVPTNRTVWAPPSSGSAMNYIPRDTPPTVSSTGAFQNKHGGSFGSPPVNGASRTVPITINGTTTKPNVNKALLGRLTRGGLAGIALGAGIEALLNSIGGLIEEGGKVVRLEEQSVSGSSIRFESNNTENMHCEPPAGVLHFSPTSYQSCLTDTLSAAMLAAIAPLPRGAILSEAVCSHTKSSSGSNITYQFSCSGQYTLDSSDHRAIRNPGYGPRAIIADAVPTTAYMPIPPTELEDAINSNYQPHPSDYPTIAAEPSMIPTIVDVEPIPRLTLPPVTTTTIDLDTGKTTTVETNIWHDFNVKDNNTNQPKIEAETTTKTDTYVDGEKTSETTITNNTGTAYPEGATDSDGNPLEIQPPIDCDLFPTACAWMEWTQEEPEEPDDDLSELLQEVPIVSETFTITGGAAACPAPLVLNLSQFGSRTVSYQPLCDLASTMKFLYLALMSFAAAVLLHRSISRV